MKKRRITMPRVKAVQEKRCIVIDKDEDRTKAALVVDGEAVEFMDSGSGNESLVGRVYAGKVEAVNKNGFAFVDIGLERNAFLNLNDNKDAAAAGRVKEGKCLAVQVTRDAYKDKGAYITTKLTWHGRYFVVEAIDDVGSIDVVEQSINVSKKITSSAERERLVRVTQDLLKDTPLPGKGIIVRTDAANTATSYLEAELARLAAAVAETEAALEGAEGAELPVLAYKPHASAAVYMAAELSGGSGLQEIIVNDKDEYELISKEFASRGVKVTLHEGSAFFAHSLSKVYETAKNRHVHLPSGGRIVIDRAEACVVVDVNSGKFSGRKNLEDMALKINTEAARETAKQLRLRNLGGMVIIDFIRMKDAENIRILENELKDALSKDPAITNVEGFTRLGLMEMTRKRR